MQTTTRVSNYLSPRGWRSTERERRAARVVRPRALADRVPTLAGCSAIDRTFQETGARCRTETPGSLPSTRSVHGAASPAQAGVVRAVSSPARERAAPRNGADPAGPPGNY